jgi:hypothetical protein
VSIIYVNYARFLTGINSEGKLPDDLVDDEQIEFSEDTANDVGMGPSRNNVHAAIGLQDSLGLGDPAFAECIVISRGRDVAINDMVVISIVVFTE